MKKMRQGLKKCKLFLDTLSTVVDSRVCCNINITVFTKHDKVYENYFCAIWTNYSKKVKEITFFPKFPQNYAKNAKKKQKCEKCENE